MSRKIIPFRRELPPDPLAGCRLMVDPERSPRRTGPGRAVVIVALCLASLCYGCLCMHTRDAIWIVPAAITALLALWGHRW